MGKRNLLNPELPVREVMNYYSPGYGICLGIITVSVDTGFDNFYLRDCQKRLAALKELVRKVDNKEVC